MANAKPSGKLTTGAIGNFLLGGAMVLFVLSGAVAGFTGGGAASDSAGILGLVAFLLIVGGGIPARSATSVSAASTAASMCSPVCSRSSSHSCRSFWWSGCRAR